jgi:hypothetical protein
MLVGFGSSALAGVCFVLGAIMLHRGGDTQCSNCTCFKLYSWYVRSLSSSSLAIKHSRFPLLLCSPNPSTDCFGDPSSAPLDDPRPACLDQVTRACTAQVLVGERGCYDPMTSRFTGPVATANNSVAAGGVAVIVIGALFVLYAAYRLYNKLCASKAENQALLVNPKEPFLLPSDARDRSGACATIDHDVPPDVESAPLALAAATADRHP